MDSDRQAAEIKRLSEENRVQRQRIESQACEIKSLTATLAFYEEKTRSWRTLYLALYKRMYQFAKELIEEEECEESAASATVPASDSPESVDN